VVDILILLLAAATPFLVVVGLIIYVVFQFWTVKPWLADEFNWDNDPDWNETKEWK
jgi:hypothetical protein